MNLCFESFIINWEIRGFYQTKEFTLKTAISLAVRGAAHPRCTQGSQVSLTYFLGQSELPMTPSRFHISSCFLNLRIPGALKWRSLVPCEFSTNFLLLFRPTALSTSVSFLTWTCLSSLPQDRRDLWHSFVWCFNIFLLSPSFPCSPTTSTVCFWWYLKKMRYLDTYLLENQRTATLRK